MKKKPWKKSWDFNYQLPSTGVFLVQDFYHQQYHGTKFRFIQVRGFFCKTKTPPQSLRFLNFLNFWKVNGTHKYSLAQKCIFIYMYILNRGIHTYIYIYIYINICIYIYYSFATHPPRSIHLLVGISWTKGHFLTIFSGQKKRLGSAGRKMALKFTMPGRRNLDAATLSLESGRS